MKEVGLIVGPGGEAIYWHRPRECSAAYLPDDRDLWEMLWQNREVTMGFAHTHPGGGLPGPSHTDLTTFAAVEAGLGRKLFWWIATRDELAVLLWEGPGKLDYMRLRGKETAWLGELRRLSYEEE